MLYSKDSFNYWIRIQSYFRCQVLFELFMQKLGHKPKEPWKSHIKNFKIKGSSYLSWENFPHHCTDGPDCEIANIYTKKEIKKL